MRLLEIFTIRIGEINLIYSPLHHLTALVNKCALIEIRRSIESRHTTSPTIEKIISVLSVPSDPIPQPRSGNLVEPYFLGILPTRGCNMACRYCDFLGGSDAVMRLDTARWAVDAYLDLLTNNCRSSGAIHFFGGEPFHTPEVVQFIVEYARLKAIDYGIHLHFEATTNGNYDATLGRWIASNLNTVVLSLDGLQEVQNYQRPLKHGKPSFEQVVASASLFSEGDCELVIRSCISNLNVDDMPRMADWIRRTFEPTAVCFEPLSESDSTRNVGILQPDPLVYARRFMESFILLKDYGIRTVLSTADFSQNQVTACPVGKDALIVSPEGEINACYLLERSWKQTGMDMHLGSVTADGFQIQQEAVDRLRQFSVHSKPLCADCFCRYHCAGSCHVNHNTNKSPGQYDELCIRTRLVSAALLLEGLGQRQLLTEWLANETQALETAWQGSDRFIASEGQS